MKRFFFAQTNAQDVLDINSIIAAWKDPKDPQIILWLNDCDNEFYFVYESEHLRDLDLARLKSALSQNLS